MDDEKPDCDWTIEPEHVCCSVHEMMAKVNHLRLEHGYELSMAVSVVMRNTEMGEFINGVGDLMVLQVDPSQHEHLCKLWRLRNNL